MLTRKNCALGAATLVVAGGAIAGVKSVKATPTELWFDKAGTCIRIASAGPAAQFSTVKASPTDLQTTIKSNNGTNYNVYANSNCASGTSVPVYLYP